MDDLLEKIKAFGAKIKGPTTATPSGSFAQSDYERVLREAGWPEDQIPTMGAIGMAESAGKVGAYNPGVGAGGRKTAEQSIGLFQINMLPSLGRPYDRERLAKDPVYNAKVALEIYNQQGLKAWGAYTDGRYKQYLGKAGTTVSEAPKTGPDFDAVRALLGTAETSAESTPDFSKVESILGTQDVKPAVADIKSRPNLVPPVTPTNPTAPAVETPTPTKPVAQVNKPAVPNAPSGSVVTDFVDYNDPGVKMALAEQRQELQRSALHDDPQTHRDVLRSAGIAPQTTPRVRGKDNDNLNTVAGTFTPVSFKDDADANRQALNAVLGKYGVTPQEVDSFVAKHKDQQFIEGSYKPGKPIEVPFSILAEIKGPEYATTEIRLEQARNRTELEELPPEKVLTKELFEQFGVRDPLVLAGSEALGLEDYANKAAANLNVAELGGGRTSRYFAGALRLLNPAVIAGLEDTPGGDKQRQIRAYQGTGEDVYKWLQKVSEIPEQNAQALNDGLYAEVFQMGGGLPGDLSRILATSMILPGGIVAATSLDLALQSAGRGENLDEVKRQAVKGAILGGMARVLVPTTRALSRMTGDKVVPFTAATAGTAVGTYAVSETFGASHKDAMKEAIFNTVLGLGDGVMALRGRTVRIKRPTGGEIAIKVDFDGNVKEITLKPGENADLEILDTNKPIATKLATKPADMDQATYDQQKAVVEELEASVSARDKDISIAQANARVDGEFLKVDMSGGILISEAISRGMKQETGFLGLYTNPEQTSALLDGLDILRQEYLDRGKIAEAKKILEVKEQAMKAVAEIHGDLLVTTDLPGAPDIERGVMQEELGHRNNRRTGLRTLLEQAGISAPELSIVANKLPHETDMQRGAVYQYDEAIAQVFRDDAVDHFQGKATKQELRAGRQALYRGLEGTQVNPAEFAAGLKDVSRSGKAFDRYARMKQRSAKPTDVIDTGDFVTNKHDDIKAPYIVHAIEGDTAVLVDAYQVDPSELRIPLTELELHTKLDRDVMGQADEYVDLLDPDVDMPDINEIADYRKIDEPQQARVHHGTRHRFAPEVLVEKPDGTQEYIRGTAADNFPEGTTVRRRGDKILVRYPSNAPALLFEGQDVMGLLDNYNSSKGFPHEAAEALSILKGNHPTRSSLDKAITKTLNLLRDKFESAVFRAGGDHTDPAVQATKKTVFWAQNHLTKNKLKFKNNTEREVYSVKEFLPEIPEGYKVVKEFPLGRFRDDKFLTGEGAMVRGAGHYAAESVGVAKSYRKAGAGYDDSTPSYMYQGQEYQSLPRSGRSTDLFADHNLTNDAIMGTFAGMENHQTDAAAAIDIQIDYLNDGLSRYREYAKDFPDDQHYTDQVKYHELLIAKFKSLDPADFDIHTVAPSPGYLYKAKTLVPDEKLLVLDKPIIDQPETIREAVDKFYKNVRGVDFHDYDADPVSPHLRKTGEEVYADLSQEFSKNYHDGFFEGGSEAASEYLRQQGIAGLKFLDQNSRHKYPEPTYKGVELNKLFGTPEKFLKQANLYGVEQAQALSDLLGDLQVSHGRRSVEEVLGNSYAYYAEATPDPTPKGGVEYVTFDGRVLTALERQAGMQFLHSLDPSDFSFSTINQTFNHVIFKGEDIDITGIQFALKPALKENKIFNKTDQDAVTEIAVKDFPAFARWFSRRPADAPDVPMDPDPNVEAAFEKARGLSQEGQMRQAAGSLVNLYHSFRRKYHELDPNKSVAHARVDDAFRRLTVVPHWAKVKAQDTVAVITSDLGPNNYKAFERIVQLRDIQREAEKGLQPEMGFADLQQVNDSLAHFEAIAAKYPEIQKALDTREKLLNDIATALVRIDQLPASVLNDPRYYHRQILSAIDNVYASTGSQDVRLHRKGFQKQRQGEKGDFNTNYLESEAEWMAQAYSQLAKYDIQQEIESAANVAPALKRDAKLRGIADWTSLIDKKTHTLWQPKEGNYFFRVDTIPEQVISDVVLGVIKPKDLPAELKEALGMGRRKPEWVVPKEVAALLDRFQPDVTKTALGKIAVDVNGTMKQWMLLNLKNFAGYNLRNAFSDLDVVIARYPDALWGVYDAYNILRAYAKDKGSPEAAIVHDAIAVGMIDSGQTFAEIPDINKVGAFKHITPGKFNPLMTAWDGMKGFTNFRENLLRLAVYKHVRSKVDAGIPVYGGSNKFQVDAITDPKLKAAKVAREFMGDYGGISEAGRLIRSHMLPFYSWMEINAPRYIRMLKNIPHEGESFKLGPALVGKGLKVAAHTPRFVVRAVAVTALMNLWNNYGPYAEHEEKLKRTDLGRQPHLIVGVREDGTPMVIRLETALTDALSWLDLGDWDADRNDIMTDKATGVDKLADAAKAPLNRVVNAVGPQIKLPTELAFGRTSYPSLFEKGASLEFRNRPIRDRWEYAARTFAVDGIYKKITGRPSPPSELNTAGGITRSVLDTVLTSRVDSDEAVYWNVRSTVSNYAEKIGKKSQAAEPTEKSNALFFYRQALKWGDEEAARRFLDKYTLIAESEGKTKKEIAEGMQKSMDKSHPLGGLDSEKWGEYIRTANQEDRNQLMLALQFYRDTYGQKDAVSDEAGATVKDLYKMVFPKPVRLIAENSTSIPMAVDIFENAGLDTGDKSRVKNAIMLRAAQKIKNKSLTLEDNTALKRIGINLVADADVKSLQQVNETKKKVQELKKAAKFGF